MSVNKVKISELPQLPQESDASGIFMPASDENNHSYRVPLNRYGKSAAGGDLVGEFPNPTIKSSVELTGSPTAPTPSTDNDSTRVATTAYVKKNLTGYVTTGDSRLSDSRTPKGTAGGSLTGTFPNPTIKSSVNLPGSPTTTTQADLDNSTKVATTAFVKSCIGLCYRFYRINNTSTKWITLFYRGGTKQYSDDAILAFMTLGDFQYALPVLIGKTRNAVLVNGVGGYTNNNNIYQDKNGLYVNYTQINGAVDPNSAAYIADTNIVIRSGVLPFSNANEAKAGTSAIDILQYI